MRTAGKKCCCCTFVISNDDNNLALNMLWRNVRWHTVVTSLPVMYPWMALDLDVPKAWMTKELEQERNSFHALHLLQKATSWLSTL